MKYLNAADLCAKIFLVPGQLCQRFSCAGKQETIQLFLVRQEERIQIGGNREYHMKVLDIQQIKALVFNPAFFQQRLAFGAMPVPAGIVGRPLVSAIRTLIHMTAQSSGSALPYCMKCFPLLDCHRMVAFICIAVLGEYILYFWHINTPLKDSNCPQGCQSDTPWFCSHADKHSLRKSLYVPEAVLCRGPQLHPPMHEKRSSDVKYALYRAW